VAFFNSTLAQQLSREQESTFLISGTLLNLNAFIVLGHFAYFLIRHFKLDWGISGIGLVGLLIFLLMCINLLRFWSFKIQSWIFPFNKEVSFYSFHIFLVNKVIGIIFLPIVILQAFIPDPSFLIWPAILTYLGLISYRYFRSFGIADKYLAFHKLHFFVYLCTAEVAPVVLIIKVLALKELL